MPVKEVDIQVEIVKFLREALPHAVVHHSANEGVRGGKKGMLDGLKKKKMGQVQGFPDLVIFSWQHTPVMFMEVKAEGNYPTDAQKRVHDQLRGLGYRVGIVRSVDDVKQRLADWGIWFNRGAA